MTTTTATPLVTIERMPAGRVRSLLEITLFVAVWIGAGYLLPPDPNLYLLIGVPLTAAFQLLVRRRPLRELWLRDGTALRLDTKGLAVALALAILPAIRMVQAAMDGAWIVSAWMLTAVAGAVPAAYALRRLRRDQLGVSARWIAIPTAAGVAIVALAIVPALLASGAAIDPVTMLATGAESLVLYLAVAFVLEEVTFRGALDSHVEHTTRRPWISALLVSLLWGLWHLPVAGAAGVPLLLVVVQLLVVHGVVGIPLSLGWRRTGNLAIPVIAHALIDAVRNALMVGLG